MQEEQKQQRFIDAEGTIFNEFGEVVLEDNNDPLMVFVHRVCVDGESIEEADKAAKEKIAELQAKIAEAKRTGQRVPL